MIELGLMGVGAWGRRYLQTVGARSDCRFKAFLSSTRPVPGELQAARACPDVVSLLTLVSLAELDGVVVATNPEHQAEVASKAVSAQVPALIEKPLGLSGAAARSVWEQVARLAQPAPLLVNYVHLFAPAFRALQAQLQAEDPITQIVTVGANYGPFRSFSALYDYGAHDVAMCLAVLGVDAAFELEKVKHLQESDTGELVEAYFHLNSVRVTLRVGNTAATKTRLFEVTTRSGRHLLYDDTVPASRKLTDSGQALFVPETAPLDVAIGEFVQRCQAWRDGQFEPAREQRAAWLSVRVLEILDALKAALE